MPNPVLPYKDSQKTKKEQVAAMFDNIAGKYDFLNHFLSLGIDKYWRNKGINSLKKYNPKNILDVATGTGDLAIAALKLNPVKVTGIDISGEMLEVGRKKISEKDLTHKIELIQGDSESMPFEDNNFDAITVAFGVRNFENLDKGLMDMHRVLKTGGRVMILEFSKPQSFPFKQLYNFYFKNILPLVGKWVSGDNSAYTYLPESVQNFPDGKAFLEKLNAVGFSDTKVKKLTFGVCALYTAGK